MSKDDTTNAVRQVLMNELGLTRDRVRGIMEDIIEATVERHAKALVAEGRLEAMLQVQIEKALKENSYTPVKLRSFIAATCAEQVRKHLNQSLPDLIFPDTKGT